MKKILVPLLLTVIWCLPGLCVGKVPGTTALKDAIIQKADNARDADEQTNIDTKDAIIKALEELVSPDNMETIGWSDFLKESQEEIMFLKKIEDAYIASWTEQEEEHFANLTEKIPTTQRYTHPNYGKETKSVRFIYLTDASAHSTKSIVNEVKRVLRSIREENPNAKIVLATEMARMKDFSAPIRFAIEGNEKMWMSDPYFQLVAEVDKLNIDLLALDSDWEKIVGETLLYKIGKYFLKIDEKNHPDFIKIPFQITEKEDQGLSVFVSTSMLGMNLRNQQWGSYINAIKPFYDIVIVYGGDAHIDASRTLQNVPEIVDEEYMLFNFYTLEKEPSGQANCREEYQKHHSEYATDMSTSLSTREKIDQMLQRHYEEAKWNQKHVMYTKKTREEEELYVKSLSKEDQHFYKQSIQKMESVHLKLKRRVAEFEIFLPDETVTMPELKNSIPELDPSRKLKVPVPARSVH